MNDEQFEEIKKILLEIKKALAIGETALAVKPEKAEELGKFSEDDKLKFYSDNIQEKLSDTLYSIFARFYSFYGPVSISKKLIEQEASEVGLIIPKEWDSTLRGKRKNGKKLFVFEGKGYKPTVLGEVYLRDKFKVGKGNETLPPELEE